MPTAAEHARILQLPMAEMTSLAEKAAVNTASTTYASIELALMQKLAACKEAVNAENVKQPQRVYVQHAVETVDRALLRQAFPKWDIKFSGVDPRANAKAQAIYFLMAQFLLDKLNQKKGLVLAYGVSLKQIVMRNRRWMHVCVAGQDVVEQAEFRRDDRAIMAMSKSWERAGKSYDLAREFAEGNTDCYCGDPRTCKKEAAAAIMMLHRTDTNFRQIAYYMQKHKVKLLYFAVPGSKHLEFGSQGHMPDLGGYVFPTVQDGKMRVNITYNGDISLDVSYDHQNYLELIGRTSVVLGDTCYHKEHVTQVLGVHVYKVTAFDAEAADSSLPPYLSWNEPNYKSLYVLHVPLLKPHGSVHIRADWEMYTYTVERDVIDSVTDWAMRADGVKDMAKSIERRLASKLTRVAGHGQVVPVNSYMAVDQFDLTALVIFVTVFMKKYVHGKTVSTVAPQARELAALSSAGVWSLARHYIVARTAEMSGWLGKCTAALRSNIGYSETSRDVPLPRFVAAVGYTPYDNAAFNPMFSSWDVGDNPVHGFSPCLPGVKPKFFDLDEQSQSDTSSESTMPYSDVQKLVVSGEAVVTSDGRIRMLDSEKSVKIGQASASIYDKVVTWVGDAYGDLKLTGTVDDDDEIQDMLLRRTFGDDILEEPEPVLGAIDDSGSDDSESLSDTEDTIEVVIPTVQQRHDQVHRAVTAADEMRRRLGGESRHADSLGVSAKYIIETEPRTRYQSHEPIVNEIVNRVYHDTGHMSTLQAHTIGVLTTYDAAAVPDIVLGAVSDDPKADLTDALNIIFPGATTYNTAYFNSDKHFSDFDLKIKSTKIAIDLTKMGTLRPEALYKPKVRSHVVPDSKNSMVDTLWTVQKRYANTPADADSLSLDDVFQHAWSCALKVYYVPEAQDILDSLPYIGPTEESIRVCVSNMDAKKRERLLNSPDGYTCAELLFGLQNNQFMIKPKTKPDLTSTYASSLKAPQGIQYDASGRSIPVFTPIISAAVMREQSILRPNFLVMQQKNLSDVNEFLNRFDWRPNERGERYYIEIDYSEYDKSQGPTARAMFWKKMELFKVLPDFLQFYRAATTNRSVAALKAGIKAWIDEQNPSGLSHTLASNTDVNLMATAELLYRIVDQIEFGMVMGDDFTLAVRGFPDISQWEAEINRKFNLSMKVAVHRHGYFCSMDIVHYPDGHSRVIADIVKRALVFTQQSVKDISNFDEKFISYADSLNGVQDKQVQLYLQSALPDRYRHLLPGLSQEAVKLLCKLHAKIRVDYDAFRGFFAEESTVTYY